MGWEGYEDFKRRLAEMTKDSHQGLVDPPPDNEELHLDAHEPRKLKYATTQIVKRRGVGNARALNAIPDCTYICTYVVIYNRTRAPYE